MSNGPLERLGRFMSRFADRWVPDPWIYAALLTFVAFGLAVGAGGASPREVAVAWQKGLWDPSILTLIAQFSLNLILCAAMARSPAVSALLRRLAAVPRTARFSIVWVSCLSILLSLISWAFCIVGGALFAQEACRQARRRGFALHYPLAIAAGYLGMMTWGCGLTSSAPLIVSTPGHELESVIGLIPLSVTLGSTANLLILTLLLLVCPWLLAAMHPTDPREIVEIGDASLAALTRATAGEGPGPAGPVAASDTPAGRLERSGWILRLTALLPLSYLVRLYVLERQAVTIDSMNLLFLTVTLLAYPTPRHMLDEIERASTAVWSIVFQFPFYAGMMGMVKGTALGAVMAEFFSRLASPATWPLIGVTFQALLNLFIPSGGAQWIVSGSTLVEVGRELGHSPAHSVLIEVMGDQLANMVQPMWALPALALAGLQARHILGYTSVVMFAGFVIMVAGLTFFPA